MTDWKHRWGGLFAAAGLFCAASVSAGPAFDYGTLSEKFVPKTVAGVRSMADGEHYTAVKEGRIVRYRYRDGEEAGVVFDAKRSELPGGKFAGYAFSSDERKILLATKAEPIYRRSFTADYWIYDRDADSLHRLSGAGRERAARFSPDGRRVAFVRDNDLYVVNLADYSLERITSDGRINHVINGVPDWVYEEEFAFSRAFEWSPDSRRIAFLRFDESEVPEFSFMRFQGKLYPEPYTYKYPKAGGKNASVELRLCDLGSGAVRRVDTGAETDQYLPRIGWTSGGDLWFYRVNRRQNRFELMLAGRDDLCSGGGEPVPARALYTETSDRYVERVDDQTVTFLPDSRRFLVRSERDGFMHLYLCDVEGGEPRPVTSGPWEVTSVVGVEGDRVYYLSTEESPLRRSLYEIGIDGQGKRRLTGVAEKGMAAEQGTYRIAPSRGFRYFLSYFSNVSTPTVVRLHTSDGRVVRTLEENASLRDTLRRLEVPVKEFFTFRTPEGTELNGYRLAPAGFDAAGAVKYPVLMIQYSGPGSQQVADSWGMDWTDVLVQSGYVVVCVDGRGTGFRGEEFKKCTYGNLGRLETEDQIAVARWVASRPWADPGRIGIYGWSYGGFMALNCILKGNDLYKMAVAVAPVTSWRFYDTIYTEIYNGLPQENPRGYDDNSPIHYADSLRGRLLLVHGTGDDNVHVQNSYEMASALVRAGRPFDMMIYPDDNHGMRPTGRHHVLKKLIEYTKEHL